MSATSSQHLVKTPPAAERTRTVDEQVFEFISRELGETAGFASAFYLIVGVFVLAAAPGLRADWVSGLPFIGVLALGFGLRHWASVQLCRAPFEGLGYWRRWFAAGVWISIGGWAVWVALSIFREGPWGETSLLMLVVTLGLSVGAMTTLHRSRQVLSGYYLIVLFFGLLGCGGRIASGHDDALTFVPVVALFGVFTLLQARNLHQTYRDAVLSTLLLRRRTDELAEANTRALASVKAKSAFLAAMSHEIRTPMNGVLGMAELLRDTEITEEQGAYLHTIEHSGRTLLTLINDILDVSKFEAGHVELERISFDVFECVDEVADLLAPKAQARGVEFVVHVDASVPRYVTGDPTRLGQILLNLTGNAVKFTQEGTVQLQVWRETSGQLSFAVVDSGIGISAEQMERLFQPFGQASSATSREYGGTGLGLVICKRLAEAMGGNLAVDSVTGDGSTFTFTVPFELNDEARVRSTSVPRTLHVVVDPNHPQRAATIELIRRMGDDAIGLTSLSQLHNQLDGARSLRPPVVLVRYPLPAGTTRDLFDLKRHHDLKLWLMTEAPRKAAVERSVRGRVDGVVGLPMRLSTLERLQRVRETLPELRAVTPLDILASRASAATPELSDYRLLCVEDNPVNQKIARRFLEREGYTVEVCDNGAAALERVTRGGIDLVLMDCQMPIMDGFEATGRIRALGPLGQLPIVAMTANAMDGDRKRCIEAGMDDYITKPVDSMELYAMLNRFLLNGPNPMGARRITGTRAS